MWHQNLLKKILFFKVLFIIITSSMWKLCEETYSMLWGWMVIQCIHSTRITSYLSSQDRRRKWAIKTEIKVCVTKHHLRRNIYGAGHSGQAVGYLLQVMSLSHHTAKVTGRQQLPRFSPSAKDQSHLANSSWTDILALSEEVELHQKVFFQRENCPASRICEISPRNLPHPHRVWHPTWHRMS